MRPEWRKCAMGICLILLTLGCGGPRSLSDFPVQTEVRRIGLIDPSQFGPAYRGGRLQAMVADGAGALYLTTEEPHQLLRVRHDGRLLWAKNAASTDEHPFQGPRLSLALSGERIVVADSGAGSVHEMDAAGNEVGRGAFSAAYRAARSPAGTLFVYPNTEGFLLDTFDSRFRYLHSIVPLPGPLGQVAPSACLLLPDSKDGVLALWNPTRTVYRLGPEGERRGEFTLDPPDLVANVEQRTIEAHRRGQEMGGIGLIHPFVDFAEDHRGHLAALYLFETGSNTPGVPTVQATVYRFSPSGEPVDVILGLGSILRVAFGPADEVFGLDREANLIHAYRLQPAPRDIAG